jgi:hypothetical protein
MSPGKRSGIKAAIARMCRPVIFDYQASAARMTSWIFLAMRRGDAIK